MALVKRLVKGAPLTAAEHDGNIDQLVVDITAKAPIASPGFSGTPTAPSPVSGASGQEVATAAWVLARISSVIGAAPGVLDTLNEIAAALGDDPDFAATVATALAEKAPIASPAMTGTPTAPTASPGENTMQLATTAFVAAAIAGLSGGGGGGSTVIVGTVPPASAPASIGAVYVDKAAKSIYISAETTATSDWLEITTLLSGSTLGSKPAAALTDKALFFDAASSDSPVQATWAQIIAALQLVTATGSVTLTNKTLSSPIVAWSAQDRGAVSSGSFTPDPTNGSIQTISNGGAFTLAVPPGDANLVVQVTNGSGAGAITPTGYAKVTGDPLTTTTGHVFRLWITRIGGVSGLSVMAMQ